MKKIIFLLFPLLTLAQNPTNFPYGIKNTVAPSNSTPSYFVTQEVDGVHKKTPAANVEKTANKSDSYTTSSSTTYASTKAVVDGLATKISGTGTINTIPKFTSAGVLGNSQIFDNGTNVLINTATDNGVDKLQVNGSALLGNATRIGDSSYGFIRLGGGTLESLNAASTDYSKITFLASEYDFTFSGASRMYLKPSGNLLIGTTTDNGVDKLQVSGTVSATSYTGSATLTGTPTAPTATAGTNTTQIATTAFVQAVDANVVHKTGEETIGLGEKYFTDNVNFTSIAVSGQATGGAAVFPNEFVIKSQLDLKAPLSSPTFTGTLVLPSTTSIGTVTNTELSYVDGVTSSIQTQLNGKQSTLTNPVTGTGTTNYLPKFTSANVLGNSQIFDNGTTINIQNNFRVDGSSLFANKVALSNGRLYEFLPTSTDLRLVDQSFGFDLLMFTSSGNLLIGTTTDNGVDKLQVNGSISATSYTGSATLTGTPTAPTATVGTNTTQIATTAFVLANARPYKVYTALLSQSGTSAPTATVLENTLGGTVVWTRNTTGQYFGTLSTAFVSDKTFCLTGGNTNNENIHSTTQRNNNNEIVVQSYSSGAKTDGVLNKTAIEIRVYN